MNNRVIQIVTVVIMLVGTAVGGSMLPRLLEQSDEAGLRYADASVEGAPPWVALGTVIGSVRGLIVDILWIKVQAMKQKGLFYEVMNDASLITKLQPQYGQVWVFHGHNMAYNISVATHTEEERWEWVKAGIRLVQTEGVKANPTDITLYKELAFWYAHKIEGYADDAHPYYKRQLAKEWQAVLGTPPDAIADRVAWMKAVADAPESLEEAERRTPGVTDVLTALSDSAIRVNQKKLEPNRELLTLYSSWESLRGASEIADALGMYESTKQQSPMYRTFDLIAANPEYAEAWETLLAFTRKKVVRDEYNMDPRIMYEYTRDLGPIDWRHGQSHALYWSRLGMEKASLRVSNVDNTYKALNNDRIFLQSLQGLARWGRVYYDPFGDANQIPPRMPEPRFVDTIEDQFFYFYDKYYNSRGAGSDSFIEFLKNFMSSAVREAYRAGERARAQEILNRLNEKFGTARGDALMDPRFSQDLDVFVKNEVEGEITNQPHMAPSEAAASLYYAYRVGVGRLDEDVYRNAMEYVNFLVDVFKRNGYNDYTTVFGTGRMADNMMDVDRLKEVGLLNIMRDAGMPIRERATIWANYDRVAGQIERSESSALRRAMVYDMMIPPLAQQLQSHPLGQRYTVTELFPPPPRMPEARALIAQIRAAERARRDEQLDRATIERSGTGPRLGGND